MPLVPTSVLSSHGYWAEFRIMNFEFRIMKKYILLILTVVLTLPIQAAKKEKVQQVDSLGRKIKTGWNFGALPSVAFDADLGFQGGALANIYYYGDGSQYPACSQLLNFFENDSNIVSS